MSVDTIYIATIGLVLNNSVGSVNLFPLVHYEIIQRGQLSRNPLGNTLSKRYIVKIIQFINCNIIFPIVILAIISLTQTNAQWVLQNSTTTQNLLGISFVDSLNGWVVGGGGIILHTTDAGNLWFNQRSGTSITLCSISFCDKQNGWALGDARTILKTSDGGITWIKVYIDTSINVTPFKVQCLAPLIAVVLQDSFEEDTYTKYRIWKTINGGISWSEISPRQGHFIAINDFYFSSELNGWASGHGIDTEYYDALQIHRTSDGGNTWKTYCFGAPTLGSVVKVCFKDSIEGWAISDSLYHSTDGGSSWSGLRIWDLSYPSDIVMFGEIGFFSEIGNYIKRTTDGGITWLDQIQEPSKYITSFSFITPEIGWGVGWNGQIIHTSNGGINSVKDQEQLLRNYSLMQNYPNPFNSSTFISFYIQHEGYVQIKIFNVLGKEVQTLLSENISVGFHKINWNPSSLPSGIYFYQLRINNFIDTKKSLFLK